MDGKIVTFKKYSCNDNIKIYQDSNEFDGEGWYWDESDFQIVFDTWEDVKDAIDEKCEKFDCCDKKCPLYYVENPSCYDSSFYSKDYKKLAENFEKMFGMECYVLEDEKMRKEFRLSDLKDEMVVETRNNHRYLVFGKIFLGLNGFMGVESYSEDFKFIMEDKDFDIIAVYPKYGNYGYGFNGILYNVKEPIWQEPITKDVSLEEINELLKEKYPDVEKFNLPIDNDK